MDIIIQNGKVYDGSGNIWFKADLGIKNGKIYRICRKLKDKAKINVDASNLIVCPGFIDPHTHSDTSLLVDGKAESAVRQGVTLQVTGNCGSSPAPIKGPYKDLIETPDLIKADWESFGQYLDKLQKSGVAINVASLVGQGIIRANIMGDLKRKPLRKELKSMKELVAESMKDGAFGMSVGLNMYPSGYADTNELVELCKVLKKYNGIYFAHMREESARFIEATLETIEIGERSGIPVHPVHHRPLYQEFHGEAKDILRIMEDARERGVDITCDLYPYMWASSGLDGVLPPWVLEGGNEKIIERLTDKKTREKAKRDMVDPKLNLNLGFIARTGCWDKVILLNNNVSEKYNGKTLLEIAGMMGVKPIDAVLDLMISEGKHSSGLPTIQEVGKKEMVLEIFKHPTAMVGSDGHALNSQGVLSKKLVHPRSYGCYPLILGRWVRDEKLISMEEAIRKMTSFPAQLLGLQDRGLLKEGMWADITVFDPKTILDNATYEKPHKYPDGINYVIVNGQVVIEKGKHTGSLPGKVLRGPGYIHKEK